MDSEGKTELKKPVAIYIRSLKWVSWRCPVCLRLNWETKIFAEAQCGKCRTMCDLEPAPWQVKKKQN